MTGIRELPLNEQATELYRSAFLAANPDADPESLPSIHGTVIVFHEPAWF